MLKTNAVDDLFVSVDGVEVLLGIFLDSVRDTLRLDLPVITKTESAFARIVFCALEVLLASLAEVSLVRPSASHS